MPNDFPGWETKVLTLIGAPSSKANIDFLDKWHGFELSTANYNPLNTTQPAGGATAINSVGVRSYPSAEIGAYATAITLQNGHYPDVLKALQSGNPDAYVSHPEYVGKVKAQISTWGTTNFANTLGSGSGGGIVDSVTKVATQPLLKTLGISNDPASHIPGVVQARSIESFLGNLTDLNFLLRVGQVIGGAVLAFAGLILLARQIGLAAPSIPGPSAAVAGAVA